MLKFAAATAACLIILCFLNCSKSGYLLDSGGSERILHSDDHSSNVGFKILECFSVCPESLDYWNLVTNSIVDTDDSCCVYGFFFLTDKDSQFQIIKQARAAVGNDGDYYNQSKWHHSLS